MAGSPWEEVYAVVFMDAIHYHVRSEGRIVKRAVHIALGMNRNGFKNRGVEDILIACVDGLSGSSQAIEAVYPQTEIQQCIIHQIRNSTKFVSYKDSKKLMADLKLVYAAPTEETALSELEPSVITWQPCPVTSSIPRQSDASSTPQMPWKDLTVGFGE